MKHHWLILTITFLMFSHPAKSLSEEITVNASPVKAFDPANPDKNRFGKLEFLGGLVLTSDHQEFGGFSGLRFTGNTGEFVAITDKARVLTGKLIRKDGKPVNFQNTHLTRIKAANGKTITGADDKDAEALEITADGFVVSYERNDRVIYFDMKERTLITKKQDAVLDMNPLGFPNNSGPEAIARDPESGKLFAIAELAVNEKGNHRGFVVSGNKIEREFEVVLKDSYSITDAAFMPDGDLIVLERYYNPLTGVFMKMRRINRSRLSGPSFDGETLVEANNSFEIDNMEGLAISEMDDGSTRLTVISDDNFSGRQRTLLLEFRLLD
ncbi:MAG: esterase-like activity of phytase family protein [Pseudomonadota bacterium]